MPKKIQKTLQDYLFKIKNPHPQIQSPLNILSSRKHPKTPSFALCNNNHNDDAATLADVDRFLFENFKSLYSKEDEEENENKNNTKRVSEESNEESPKLASILFESPRLLETPRDLCGSARFFVSPGFSGSLMEDALTSMTTTTTCDEAGSTSITTTTLNGSPSNSQDLKEAMDHTLPENCIALLTYSPNPYEDFRRSMQEMVEARFWNRERVIDWDFMEEILFCYLNLNEKKSHKFILAAFVDLTTVMRRNLETAPAKPRSVRTVRIGRELRKKTRETTYLLNVTTYNAVSGGWSKFGRVNEIERIMEEMEADAFRPDCTIFSFFLEGLGRAGRLEEGVEVFCNMKKKTCQPDTAAYNVMIFNFISVGDFDECMKYYNGMLSDNCKPNLDTPTAFPRARKVADALLVFDEMLR
ncbi:transcription repressor OFP14-like [Gastrolobium bilobum]|uniref:transcription repressor OFP14-like n=1 Tax=Gastrolobium bilobum TaxID=150636 RepID=UPI002AB1DF8F|nr:transcription repressor OFP14-like [Gastrolobium bilobum]